MKIKPTFILFAILSAALFSGCAAEVSTFDNGRYEVEPIGNVNSHSSVIIKDTQTNNRFLIVGEGAVNIGK